MINLDKLYQFKKTFGFFSHQLVYPEKLNFHPREFEGVFDETHPAYEAVKQYWDNMHEISLSEIQEVYTHTFDFEKKTTLYMTYVKFEDQKERGQMLARLKVLYEMFGLEMPSSELSDFLPLMCEFIYAAEWRGDDRAEESMQLLLMVIEDGTYNLVKALEAIQSPYYHLVLAIRETCKACLNDERGDN
ncbi:nitrate reductase molybdenum cofactor assembly chaperone [Macrococcus sp. DPC7161]|uniref:nitrate reductase molybdenum cofactor assembly chaperone n=1 Tax=Macrococcus sp. DPC7161 TaxID=2507060 RepID=UPI00100BC584|nr:nitrate reductase molybdenum cofactor assembly chaperone [Macrococcus sp. DPC7161]RXK18587.1 nitrate reductase molybdenum cofactor assembly chaperone [Macrococcus sp. DPC7161]